MGSRAMENLVCQDILPTYLRYNLGVGLVSGNNLVRLHVRPGSVPTELDQPSNGRAHMKPFLLGERYGRKC
jgi:hypothetical protein